MKLWGGRFTKATDRNVEEFNSSIQFDCRMYAEDICGSIAHVVIDGWTTIGKYCRFFPSASIGSEPQDLKFNGEKSYVTIGDYSVFREFVTVSRATGEEDVTSIGSHCLFQACTHIAHNCDVGNYVIMSNCAGLAGHAA